MYPYSENYNASLYDQETSQKSPYRNKSHISRDNFRVIKTPLPRRCPPVIRDKDVEYPPKYSSNWSAFFAEKTLAKLKEIIKQRTEREDFINKGNENEAYPEDKKLQVSEIKKKLFKAVDNIQYEPEKREIKELIEQIIYSGEEKEIRKAIEDIVYASEEQALEEAVRQVDDRETTEQAVNKEKNYTKGTNLYSDELHQQLDCPIEKDSNETLEGESLKEHEIEEPDVNNREENNLAGEIGNTDMEFQDSGNLTPHGQNLESIMADEPGFEQPFPEEPPEMTEPFSGGF